MTQAENRQRVNEDIQIRRGRNSRETANLQLVNTQRNPYLVEYGTHRKVRSSRPNTARSSRVEASERSRAERTGMSRPEDARPVRARSRRAAKRRRRARQRRILLMLVGCIFALLMCGWLYFTFFDAPEVDGSVPPVTDMGEEIKSAFSGEKIQGLKASDYYSHPNWTEDFLTVNEYSRPGDALKQVNSIFVHYTANPGTSAAQNRSYFEQLKDTQERSASAHFIIGYEGEIIQCVPLDEIAYAVVGRNEDSISIECCYMAEDGSFTQETYDSLITLLKWLTDVYDLEEEDILRHYDCGGKKCPLYYTEHEDAWEQLKRDVSSR